MWSLVPLTSAHIISCVNYGLLWLFALSSLKVYTIFFAGWSSNSKYPLLGGLRSVAQVISYEISIGFCFLCVSILAGTFDLMGIVDAQRGVFFFFPLFPIAILFFIVVIAETNRPPFDMAEAESELVAGYNLEYPAIYFAYLFLSEYCSILVMSALWVLLFFGGWLPICDSLCFIPEIAWMIIKTLLVCFFMIVARGIMPRYRYDQLMSLGWKVFFVFAFGFLVFLVVICYYFGFNRKRQRKNTSSMRSSFVDVRHNNKNNKILEFFLTQLHASLSILNSSYNNRKIIIKALNIVVDRKYGWRKEAVLVDFIKYRSGVALERLKNNIKSDRPKKIPFWDFWAAYPNIYILLDFYYKTALEVNKAFSFNTDVESMRRDMLKFFVGVWRLYNKIIGSLKSKKGDRYYKALFNKVSEKKFSKKQVPFRWKIILTVWARHKATSGQVRVISRNDFFKKVLPALSSPKTASTFLASYNPTSFKKVLPVLLSTSPNAFLASCKPPFTISFDKVKVIRLIENYHNSLPPFAVKRAEDWSSISNHPYSLIKYFFRDPKQNAVKLETAELARHNGTLDIAKSATNHLTFKNRRDRIAKLKKAIDTTNSFEHAQKIKKYNKTPSYGLGGCLTVTNFNNFKLYFPYYFKELRKMQEEQRARKMQEEQRAIIKRRNEILVNYVVFSMYITKADRIRILGESPFFDKMDAIRAQNIKVSFDAQESIVKRMLAAAKAKDEKEYQKEWWRNFWSGLILDSILILTYAAWKYLAIKYDLPHPPPPEWWPRPPYAYGIFDDKRSLPPRKP